LRILHHKFRLILALSLLLLGWLQLHHELTDHLGHSDESCEICVFMGHLGDGAHASLSQFFSNSQIIGYLAAVIYDAPALEALFRSVLTQRGPPTPNSV
jgi:hypothetical protein